MTHEMIAVHQGLRRESRRLLQLVGPGDAIRDYLRRLREHFTVEDELVWPLLLARLDLEADAVLRMEQQHKVLAAGLAEIEAAWQALVDALDRHRRDLLAHFDDEEQHILPLIAEYLTVGERD